MESREPLESPQNSTHPPGAPQRLRRNQRKETRRDRLSQVSTNKQALEKDALTGLHGQRYLCRAIDACLAQSRRRKLTATLALLQLENFYEIRSWVGLSEADLLLSEIAQLLKAALPERVLLCRCHHYEFAALLIADCSVNARLITDKVKQALLSAVSPTLPRQLELKCGVGLAKLESNIPSWPVVFARARHNLSLAHYHRELPAHLASISPEIALRQLQEALERNELALNFQALARLQEDPQQHYEVRCSLALHENSLPTVLLFETAARNALGERLDRRILEQVINRVSNDTVADRRLLVNLSHNSLVSTAFLQWLEQRLGSNTQLASQIVLQISEIDALIAQHHLISFCQVIKKLGCALSLSNFGCTPKPLRYLSLVPASYVKLDTGLLTKIDMNQGNLAAVESLTAELHERNIRVIAPMLERLPVLPLLWRTEIDFMQGNCLHSPSSCMNYEFLKTQPLHFPAAS